MRFIDDKPRLADFGSAGRSSAGSGSPLPPSADPSFLSPSLRGKSAGIAYEIKFLLTEDVAREVERRVAAGLTLDPHTDPALGNAYRTTTLYCDTPAFEVFHGTGPGRNRKHRARRYGSAGFAFLERKTKRGTKVRKRRTAVPLDQLPLLTGEPNDLAWEGEWFRLRLLRRDLRPVCRVTYDRTAYAGETAEGPLRLTFDRRLRGTLAAGWDLDPVLDGVDLLGGLVITEFKFEGALPLVGKRVVEDLGLEPGSASKYRRFLRGTGLVVEAPAPEARAAG